MDPNISSANFYKVLGIPTNATQLEIKQARDNLARQVHPDKVGTAKEDLMKRINQAYSVLSNPDERAKYDHDREDDEEDFSNPFSGGLLHVGRKLSDEFKQKIKAWKKQGPLPTDLTSFHDLSYGNSKDVTFIQSNHPEAAYECLLNASVPSVENILADTIPASIWKWSVETHLGINKSILNSDVWCKDLQSKTIPPINHPFPIHPELKKINVKFSDIYHSEIKEVQSILSAKDKKLSLPNIQRINESIQSFYAATSSNLFSTKVRLQPGTEVSLCPPHLKTELGYIPKNDVKADSVILDADATNCSGCKKSFGLFLWRNNCAMCGNANCSDCQEYRPLPEYSKPVSVCKCCGPKIFTSYISKWIAPLENRKDLKTVTNKYLLLMDYLGWMNSTKFLELADQFIAMGKYDLAIQCYYSGNGEWIELASKLASLQQYHYAKICLNQIQKRVHEWAKQGDDFAKSEIALALMCYQKAEFESSDYVKKALEYFDQPIGKSCLIMAIELLPYPTTDSRKLLKGEALRSTQKNEYLSKVSKQAMQEKKYPLAIFCYAWQEFSIQKWVEIVNQMDIDRVDPFIQWMNDFFKCDWKTIRFNPDKDHLRWRFLSSPKFERWLDYLIDLLQYSDVQNGISYFRSHFNKENFMVHRDEFFAQGNYEKALVCHRLIPNCLSWKGLAQKLRNKNEIASFICYLQSPDFSDISDFEKLGDELFQEGNFSLALRCYLHAQSFHKIKEISKNRNYAFEMRLLYQIALWKYDLNNNIIADICKTLLSKKDHLAAVQKILIASLQKSKMNAHLIYHQLLVETEISTAELFGLLHAISKRQDLDKEWAASTSSKALTEFVNQLRIASYQCSFKEIFLLLDCFNPSTWPLVNKLIVEFQIDEIPRSPKKSVGLFLRAAANLANPSGANLFEAMNDLIEAMLGDPREECIHYCAKLTEKIANCKAAKSLRGSVMTDIQFSKKTEFSKALQRTPQLRMLLRSENAISKFEPFDAAMSYIDLCMAISNAPGLVEGFLTAALELLKAQQSLDSARIKKKYAYRRAIVELVVTAYTIGNRHLCPATQLYAIRSSIAILTAALGQFKQISSTEQMILEDLYREVDRLSKVVPLMMGRMLSIYDAIYLDLINREFLSTYLTTQRDSPEQAKNPNYQYYIFEGTWKGWLSDEKFHFEDERKRTMQALLTEKGNTMADVEGLMNWPALTRDSEGWNSSVPVPLKLKEQTFSRVEAIRFNLETGEISLILQSSKNPMDARFDMEDVIDILKRGVTGAQFTLDPPNPDLPNHPFQNMLYLPECLSGTNCLGTLLHADIRLKEFMMRTEISSRAPFALRDADENLLRRLPEDLRKKFTLLHKESPQTTERINRCWIELGRLFYHESHDKDKNEISFTFGKCEVSVKTHLMRRDRDGHLVDADDDHDPDSPEAKFAKLMTEEYENIGKSFPEFARIPELAKIQAMSVFAQNIYASMKKASKNYTMSEDEIESKLTYLKDQIKYPQTTERNIESLVVKCLRENHVNRSSIPTWQLQKLKKEIRESCSQADKSCVEQVADVLRKQFHVSKHNHLKGAVKTWLDSHAKTTLVSLLKQSVEAYQKDQFLNVCRTFKRNGIATKTQKWTIADRCSWIPAAFSKNDHHKIYGGVDMNARLTSGGPVNPGASGTGYRHVVRMDTNGRIYGTTTCVDRVTGNTYRALDISSSVRDQWNENRPPNISAFWKSYAGNTTTEHYTAHTNGAVHLHHTSGMTDCTNAKGQTTSYPSGSRSHRCDK